MANLPENTKKKVQFILAWYEGERKNLDDEKRKALLEKWIKSCSRFEEYEMADALLKEKMKLLRQMRRRSLVEKFALWVRVIFRKLK